MPENEPNGPPDRVATDRLCPRPRARAHGSTAVALTPGWLRSEAMLEAFGVTDLDGSQPDAWRYLPEVKDPGRPADTTGYR